MLSESGIFLLNDSVEERKDCHKREFQIRIDMILILFSRIHTPGPFDCDPRLGDRT